ncbi:hypothetical protein [Pseudomonas fluorescens group sp. PF-69]
MSHAVLFLGGPLDGTRTIVEELPPFRLYPTWDSEKGIASQVVYRLKEIHDADGGLAGQLYVREGLGVLAQLLHGYREARA